MDSFQVLPSCPQSYSPQPFYVCFEPRHLPHTNQLQAKKLGGQDPTISLSEIIEMYAPVTSS